MSFHSITTIQVRGRILDLSIPRILGIVNVTPDSFYDGGTNNSINDTLEHCENMLLQGADVLDIGGASSRPGATEITASEERQRVCPVIEALRTKFPDVLLSVDTYRSEVAKAAIESGADIINDISAGELDSKMLGTVADLNVPYIIMHMQGRPETMQKTPQYDDVVIDVTNYLSERIQACRTAGIVDIIVDPGFGFGKTISHNYRLLKCLDHLELLGHPVLVGLSRKRMIQRVLDVEAEGALNGTTALHMYALEHGATMLRVHDVKEAVECVKLHVQLDN